MEWSCRVQNCDVFDDPSADWLGQLLVDGPTAVLSTDRAESCQGLPVVVVSGRAYGPADLGATALIVVDCDEAAEAARAAGYTTHVRGSRVEPPDSDCTDMGDWLTY